MMSGVFFVKHNCGSQGEIFAIIVEIVSIPLH